METHRILMATTFYPPYHVGGDANHVQYLAEALAAAGHEVHVEFSPAAYRLKRREPREAQGQDGRVITHPIPAPFGRAQPLAAYAIGRSRGVTRFHEKLIREVRPDVVHCHNVSLLGLGVFRPTEGGRLLYSAHDYWLRCPRSDLLKNGTRLCDYPSCTSCALASLRPPQLWRHGKGWQNLRAIDTAIAPSRFMAAAIRPALGCPVVHIANFVPDRNPGGTVTDPEDYFLFVGALENHKGVGVLIDAASRLTGTRIKVVGGGSQVTALRESQRNGIGGLEVEGWVPQARLIRLYRHARALIVPSIWHENAPLVAIEALSAGTPLLVARRGGLEELTYGGRTGRSFAPTGEDLARALADFQREDLDHALRLPARRVFERFHRSEGYVTRYLEVVRNGPQSPSAEGEGREADAGSLIPEPARMAGGIDL